MAAVTSQHPVEEQTVQDTATLDDRVAALSDKQRKTLEEMFHQFDSDGNGSISVEEIGPVLQALGWSPTQEKIKEIIREADDEGNQNGLLELGEFIRMMVKENFFASAANVEEEEKELREAFKFFDKDNSGKISASELMTLLTELGDEPLTIEEAQEIIDGADKNGDGELDYEEFRAKMTETLLESTD